MVNIQFAPSINQETGMAPQYPQFSRRSFCERDDSALQWLQKLREYLWTLYCISIVDVLECLFLNAEAAGRLAGLGSLSNLLDKGRAQSRIRCVDFLDE